MSTLHQTSFLSELETEDAVIPEGKLAYFGERLRNNLYSFILEKYLEREAAGFTKAQLARRIQYDPARINRLLGAPGNWTIDTISDLLIGIAAEEFVPASRSLLEQPVSNRPRAEWVQPSLDPSLRTGTSSLNEYVRAS